MPKMIGPSPSTLAATRTRRGFGRQLHRADSELLLLVRRVLAARDSAWPTIARTSLVSATCRSPNGPAYLAAVGDGDRDAVEGAGQRNSDGNGASVGVPVARGHRGASRPSLSAAGAECQA